MIALDTNIVLEILEKRRKLQPVLNILKLYADENHAVSTVTLSTVFYFAETDQRATAITDQLLRKYKYLDVTAQDAEWAFAHYKGDDFEDALQVAAALRQKCTAFLTLDAGLAKKYSKFLKIELIK